MKAVRYPRDFKPELYPQKHGQEDQDRVQHDPHNVGSPTPSLVYSLLAHGEFSLASHAMVSPLLSLPPNGWTGPWDIPELFLIAPDGRASRVHPGSFAGTCFEARGLGLSGAWVKHHRSDCGMHPLFLSSRLIHSDCRV